MEAILINKTPCDQILNGRGEWGMNVIPRLAATEDGELVPQTQKTDTHKRKSPLDTTDGNLLLSEFERQFSMRKKRARLEKDIDNGILQS